MLRLCMLVCCVDHKSSLTPSLRPNNKVFISEKQGTRHKGVACRKLESGAGEMAYWLIAHMWALPGDPDLVPSSHVSGS